MHTSTGDVSLLKQSSGYAYLISIAAALGGLLFGFDIAVINGALVFLRKQFGLTDFQTEIAASALLAGCVLGASIGGTLSDRFGRKKILLWTAVLFVISSVGAALPRNLGEFVAARVLGGFAIGMESMLCPLYIAEISPARIRGRLVSLNQLAIVTGILIAYFLSWVLSGLGDQSWRWMFASAVLPSALFLMAFLRAPESPRWLIKQGRVAEARTILAKLNGAEVDQQVREIAETISEEGGSLRQLLQPGFRRPLVIAVVLATLQQVTGINTILFYGSIIFTKIGSQSASAALWWNVIVGMMNLVCTIAALMVIDRVGRKPLLMIAAGGMGVSMTLLGVMFLVDSSASTLILGLILSCVAFFGIGLGPGVWLLMSELFPTRVRGRAMSIATISLWMACVALTSTFLTLVNTITASGAFWTYAAMCFFTCFFVWRFTPETKGKTLEQIERSWKRA